MLEINDVRKNYGDLEVLKGISFSVAKGQVVSIIGTSGSGKTTLLRCITGLEQFDGGEVMVAGSTNKDTKAFGLVFQNFQLFPQYTALENIMLAPKLQKLSFTNDEGMALLKKVGLEDKAGGYPYQLSGGQKQRVAIARALALKPQILCFDEPTSALDPELTSEVLKVIRQLRDQGHTMIIVTHELDFARQVSDMIIYMKDGKIEEMGTPRQIFESPEKESTYRFVNQIFNQ